MSFTLDNIGALDRLKARFRKLENPDATPLMTAWMDIIRADNREGILAGTDKNGMPMVGVKYRPDPKADLIRIRSKGAVNLRLGQHASRKHDLAFGGMGPHISGWNNNLTSREYRRLSGPPLAPRGVFSRVITNLLTAYSRTDAKRWEAFGYWDQVVGVDGRPFLHHHFEGGLHLPIRDLRGVRPLGVKYARDAARAWMMDQIRHHST